MSDREALVAAYLDAELPAGEEEALLAALKGDPAFARDMAGLLVTERLLRFDRPGGDGAAFAREVLERLGPGGGSIEPQVVRRVRRRWIPWAVAAAAVLAAVGVILMDLSDPPAVLVDLDVAGGEVRARYAHEWPLVSGLGQLVTPAAVRTGPDGRAALRFRDATRIALRESSEVRDVREESLRLERGGIGVSVQRPIRIETPHGAVSVLGTELDLRVTARSTRVEVGKGRVRAARTDGAAVEVAAGQYALMGPGMELAVRPTGVTSGLLALYRFHDAVEGVIPERTGAAPDLRLLDGTGNTLLEPWKIGPGVTAAFADPPAPMVEACRKSRALTIELWMRRDGQGPGPSHVVRTLEPSGQVRLYVDGVEKAAEKVPIDFARWDGDFRSLLVDDVSRRWPWPGEYFLLALYDRALSPEEVRRNLGSGRHR